jgi:hypothetical protein
MRVFDWEGEEKAMAIKIDKDHNSDGTKYRVTIHDAGFGRGMSTRGLSLDAALELVRHYYMVPTYVKADCPWCVAPSASKGERR